MTSNRASRCVQGVLDDSFHPEILVADIDGCYGLQKY
jgi:hypothetical protein